MLHYLRIAVTALSLTACVLLLALWVPSYTWRHYCRVELYPIRGFWAESAIGEFGVFTYPMDKNDERRPPVAVRQYSAETDPCSLAETPHGFKAHFSNGYASLVAPHWFLVILTGAIGAALQFHPTTRFSLRTLLIATTLVAAGMGIFVAMS